jgi:hypothetical protein
MDTNNEKSSSWERGFYDASRGRPPIFRWVGQDIEPTIDDPMADEWESHSRVQYLEGYEAGSGE